MLRPYAWLYRYRSFAAVYTRLGQEFGEALPAEGVTAGVFAAALRAACEAEGTRLGQVRSLAHAGQAKRSAILRKALDAIRAPDDLRAGYLALDEVLAMGGARLLDEATKTAFGRW